MSTVNYYDVLNVSQDCTIKDIKQAHRELVLLYHPDKPSGDEEMFELVSEAYNILVNPNTRKEYDALYAQSVQLETDHFDLKSRSQQYYKNAESVKKTPKDEIEFKKVFEEMDRKHGYTRSTGQVVQLTEAETKKKLADLKIAREQDDIEAVHEKLFDDGRFSLEKFNSAFDGMHKRHDELIPHQGNPDAYNAASTGLGGCYSTVGNYENLYAEDEDIGNTVYGSVKLVTEKKKKLSKHEVDRLAAAEYTRNHKLVDDNYKKSLEDRMRERELETKKLDDRTRADFDQDCAGYGIFDKVVQPDAPPQSLAWVDTDEVKQRYQKLLESRRL